MRSSGPSCCAVVPIRSSKARTRPCLLFQIKRCSGPCTGEISQVDYAELVKEARDFLSGRSGKVKSDIAAAMQEASDALDFERAALHRDRLSALSHVQGHQGINPRGVEEADVFAIHQEGGHNCIEVFFFRTGQNWGNRAYFPKADPSLEPGEVLGAFLAQFYDDKPCPRALLLSHEVEDQALLADALSARSGRKVSVTSPQRGEKRELVTNALDNARAALGRRLAETSSQKRLLQGLAETLGLAAPPRRVEVYDNSHIMGANAVGAMIVAGPEGFVKNQYRKFNIRAEGTSPGDDLAMMREVMQRRFSRLIKDHGEQQPDMELAEDDDTPLPAWPDLILIDGGQGQMGAVQAVLAELGIADRVTAIGVAKGVDREAGRERFFMQGRQPFTLPVRDPVLYFVQRLRDEAHRFAIGSHRGPPQEGAGPQPAGRDRRHRPSPQTRPPPPFRDGKSRQPRRRRGSSDRRGRFRGDGPRDLQPLSSRGVSRRSLAAFPCHWQLTAHGAICFLSTQPNWTV